MWRSWWVEWLERGGIGIGRGGYGGVNFVVVVSEYAVIPGPRFFVVLGDMERGVGG